MMKCVTWNKQLLCGKKIVVTSSICVSAMMYGGTTSALTYQDTADVSFTIQPSVSISLSSSELVIDDLAPGQSKDSNIITLTTLSNSPAGYSVGATVGNSTDYPNNNLKHKTDTSASADYFTSLATTDSVADLTSLTAGKWGYAFSLDNGTSWINANKTGSVNNTGYSGLPLYTTTTPAELVSVDTNASRTIQFKIAASSKDTQAAGEYNNVINFVATANPVPEPFVPQPVVTNPGYISYNPNAPTTESPDTMGDQAITNTATSANLWASNFQREGYGFAGWNTEPDYTGTSYGPNETITFTAGQYSGTNPGLSLYAIWIKSAGNLQDFTTTQCNTLTKANEVANPNDILTQSLTALTDTRDQQTYAVARLADGNCWMIENLRLDNQYTTNAADIAKAQGYNSRFIGLANPENTLTWNDSTTANSLYSTDGSTSAPAITGSYQAYRFPRYNNQNTASPVTNMIIWDSSRGDSGQNTYSVGNWYTWAAAIADTSNYTSGTHNTTSICPAGWHIPSGGSASAEYGALDVAMGGTGATQSTTEASMRWRRYPQNFVYSGLFSSGSPYTRGGGGFYWSSAVSSSVNSYNLYLDGSSVSPGTNYYGKYYGNSVRCLAGVP